MDIMFLPRNGSGDVPGQGAGLRGKWGKRPGVSAFPAAQSPAGPQRGAQRTQAVGLPHLHMSPRSDTHGDTRPHSHPHPHPQGQASSVFLCTHVPAHPKPEGGTPMRILTHTGGGGISPSPCAYPDSQVPTRGRALTSTLT